MAAPNTYCKPLQESPSEGGWPGKEPYFPSSQLRRDWVWTWWSVKPSGLWSLKGYNENGCRKSALKCYTTKHVIAGIWVRLDNAFQAKIFLWLSQKYTESQVFAFNVQNIFGCISLPEANCLRNSFHIQHSWYSKKKKKKKAAENQEALCCWLFKSERISRGSEYLGTFWKKCRLVLGLMWVPSDPAQHWS